MEIQVDCENEEEKQWFEKHLDGPIHEAIFDLGATVLVDGWQWTIKGYNDGSDVQNVPDESQTKLRGMES